MFFSLLLSRFTNGKNPMATDHGGRYFQGDFQWNEVLFCAREGTGK
jgi:hypothetical protein